MIVCMSILILGYVGIVLPYVIRSNTRRISRRLNGATVSGVAFAYKDIEMNQALSQNQKESCKQLIAETTLLPLVKAKSV